ncbi:[SSU ribosomal protein S5P]-alanine acetyltransferase [Pedococcus dokdonensis]|uniref:[SSU ribosomal protein S5P]-alanine acetyltransferase n=1 Tax=Pedococcus dokdonensis TaxID=443156 RepID=A0A1H0LL08_9MICO|nr:GNAT family protein [Pedococcus dokdonensis]SDO68580.1 [SSU ribosomal protein S5P]-alanine acetyltransferase [Pedococcus dokdonensis]
MLPDGYLLHPLTAADAAALAAAAVRNREHLRPWEPSRPEAFFTEAGQREVVDGRLRQVELDLFDCSVLWHGDDVVGAANLQNIVRGAMLGADLGYWVDVAHLRRGLGVALVEHLVQRGRDLGLHRLGASTMVANEPSQSVLRRCGFAEVGRIPAFLYLDGDWRDSILFNLVLHDGPPRG